MLVKTKCQNFFILFLFLGMIVFAGAALEAAEKAVFTPNPVAAAPTAPAATSSKKFLLDNSLGLFPIITFPFIEGLI